MNASESIKVAIEFVSKQVDPGGAGGTVTSAAQTGDLAFFSIIFLFLVCALAFAMFKAKNVFSFENVFVGKHAKSKISHGGGRFNAKTPIIIAVCVALIACLGIATTKAIAANASNGLVVQPDKIQIPIDETTGQPDPVNFKFFNNSSDYYLFNASLMSLTDEAKSLTKPTDWDINISGGNTTIYAGNPDGTTWYDIESIQTLIPAQSIDSVLSFTKFDVNIAKSLIGKQVFELKLTYNEQNVSPNPKVNTNLVYNGEEQVGVEEGDGYVLSGVVKGTNAGTYSASAKLADGYDCWEDGTTQPKTITWSIAKAESNYTQDNKPQAAENLYYQATNLNLLSNPGQTDCGTIWYSTDGGASYSQTQPVGKDASNYTVLVKIQGDKNHENSDPVTISVNIGKTIVKNMTVQGATVTVAYDGNEHKCPANPSDPFYIVTYEMEEGYSGAGVYSEKVLTSPVMTNPLIRTEIGITYFGIGSTYLPYYEDTTNVQVNNWTIHDGFLKINTMTPKAILTRENEVFSLEKSLIFVYDNIQWETDPIFIEEVYDVAPTVYDPDGRSQNPSWTGCDPKVVKIEQSFKEFTKFPDTQETQFTSMDLWFAGMQNLEKIEGLENIHPGITSLNATFMNTNLHNYTFPEGFFDGITSTHSMFKGCSNVEEIDVSNWTYTSFTNTTSMFEGCSALKHIYCKDGTDWADKTPAVESSNNMFSGCNSLTKSEGMQSNNINNAHEPSKASNYAAYFEVLSLHDNLYQYTVGELKVVSDYLTKHYTEESNDPICVKFRNFRDAGLTTDGSDNGVDMKINPNKNNHWAIDANNRIASDSDFENDCDADKTIQARIIGICEDKGSDGKPIGLTFMTTHALQSNSAYETDGTAEYGWSGDSDSGSCTLRTFLTDSGNTLFPQSLRDIVKTAAKGYQFSGNLGYATAYDKFWAPSMKELYSDCSDGSWPNKNEGSQYKAFLNKVSESSYSPLANIDLYQSGIGLTDLVWSRSLWKDNANFAQGIRGLEGGRPDRTYAHRVQGVVSCFCI